MKTYLFAVPLAAGKTETFKNYIKEINGARNEDFRQSRRRAGVEEENVYLQHTPQGDMCVVMVRSENPQRFFDTLRDSNEPFDRWFRDKILIEAHGLDLSKAMTLNQQIVEYREVPVRETVSTRKSG